MSLEQVLVPREAEPSMRSNPSLSGGAGCVGNEAAYLLHPRGGKYACRIRTGPDGDRMPRLFT